MSNTAERLYHCIHGYQPEYCPVCRHPGGRVP